MKNKEKILSALLSTPSVAAAAAKTGISERTIFRTLEDADFAAEYRNAQTAIVENAVSQLQKATTEAVYTLRKNMRCGNPQVETRAAQLVLDHTLANFSNIKNGDTKTLVISFNFNNQVRITNE